LVEFGEELLGLRLFAAAVDPAVEFRRVEADAGVFHRAEGFSGWVLLKLMPTVGSAPGQALSK
jgi:hypothetical protein